MRSDKRVAADHGARAGVQLHLDQQRIGEPARLVGDDAPGETAVLELGQHFVAAFEQLRVFGELAAIDVEQPHAHGFVLVGRQRAEAEPHQRMAAVRDLATHRFVRQRRRDFPAARSAFSASVMSCAVSSSVPSRSNNTPLMMRHHSLLIPAREMHEVVHRRILRERALFAYRVVPKTRDVHDLERGGAREARDFGGFQQPLVFMRAARHEIREVFGADDRQQEGFEIAVDRGDEHVAAGSHQFAEHVDGRGRIGNVLEHFHAGEHVEPRRGFCSSSSAASTR